MTGRPSSIIGDSSLNGWATFLVYLTVMLLCVINARKSRATLLAGARNVALVQARRRFWRTVATLLLLLGLSRQLDLQYLLAQLARRLFETGDIPDGSDGLQLGMVVAIGVFGTIGLLIALVTFRKADGAILAATAGAAVLVIFTIIRTIALQDVDRFLRQGVPHARINNLIEIGALVMIAIAAFVFARHLRIEEKSARLRDLSIQERRRKLGQQRRSARS